MTDRKVFRSAIAFTAVLVVAFACNAPSLAAQQGLGVNRDSFLSLLAKVDVSLEWEEAPLDQQQTELLITCLSRGGTAGRRPRITWHRPSTLPPHRRSRYPRPPLPGLNNQALRGRVNPPDRVVCEDRTDEIPLLGEPSKSLLFQKAKTCLPEYELAFVENVDQPHQGRSWRM